jgi:hypothetical protein
LQAALQHPQLWRPWPTPWQNTKLERSCPTVSAERAGKVSEPGRQPGNLSVGHLRYQGAQFLIHGVVNPVGVGLPYLFELGKVKPIKLSLILSLVTLLSIGCAAPKVWYQEGKSLAETQRQLARCRAEAARLNSPLEGLNMKFFLLNNMNKDEFILNCMQAEGYSLVASNSLPSGVRGVPNSPP